MEPTIFSSCLGFLNVATIRRFETIPKKLSPISRSTSIMQSVVGLELCSKSEKENQIISYLLWIRESIVIISHLYTIHYQLEHVWDSKKMLAQAKHIFGTVEYFWVDHKSKNFCSCLATRWYHHHFCWKLEFSAEIFLWILLGRKLPLGYFGSIFCPKMGLKCPKTFTHLVAKSTVKQSSFWAF